MGLLSDIERRQLGKILRSQKKEDCLIKDRVRIILKVDEGKTDTEIAQELKLSRQTVARWRYRFLIRCRKKGIPIPECLKDRGETEEEKKLRKLEVEMKRLRKKLQRIRVLEPLGGEDDESR